MIQFNLLPDVKLEYIRTQRTKRMVVVIAAFAAAVSFGIFVLLFTLVNVLQKNHLNHLSTDIDTYVKELQAKPDLDKVLTIQNQLRSLPALHDKKPVASRLFAFMSQVTPNDVSIGNFTVDFTANTMLIEGNAPNLELVNRFADTLKFTEYKTTVGSTTGQAFTNVVLAEFSRSAETSTFNITASYDPIIFDSLDTVELTVPQIISTRSETQKPNPLFELLQTPGTEE